MNAQITRRVAPFVTSALLVGLHHAATAQPETPPHAQLTLADFSLTNGATIHVAGVPDSTYVIRISTNLLSPWTPLQTNTLPASGEWQFVDTNAARAQFRFYSARDITSNLPSCNVVGFLHLLIPSNLVFIANPFLNADNRIETLLPEVPDGVQVWETAGAPCGVNWRANSFLAGRGWSNPNMQILPGAGLWLYNPWPQTFDLVFKGNVPQGNLAVVFSTAAGYDCSSPLPIAGGLSTVLGYTASPGDECFLWDNVSAWRPVYHYVILPGTSTARWLPSDPMISVGQALGLRLYSASGPHAPWIQNALIGTPCDISYANRPPSLSGCAAAVFIRPSGATNLGLVFDAGGLPLTSGCSFRARFYAGTNSVESEMVPRPPMRSFLNPPWAGCLDPEIPVPIPDSWYPQPVFLQLRVWDYSSAESYEAALTKGAATGKSSVLGPFYPWDVLDLQPFTVPAFDSFSVSGFCEVCLPALTCDPAEACVGEPFQYQVHATCSPTNYAADGLPPCLGINPDTGLISGTPTLPGTFPVTLRVKTRTGSATNVLSLTVNVGGLFFFDDFEGPALKPAWQAVFSGQPLDVYGNQAAYLGAPTNYVFEVTDPGATSYLHLANTLPRLSRVGWSTTNIFNTPNFRYEVRFNTRDQADPSHGGSIDGLMEIWIIDATNYDRCDKAAFHNGGYGYDRQFNVFSSVDFPNQEIRKPCAFANFTDYRLVIEASSNANVRAYVLDDANNELASHTFAHNGSAFSPGGLRLGLTQYMDVPTSSWFCEAAVDYARFTAWVPAPAVGISIAIQASHPVLTLGNAPGWTCGIDYSTNLLDRCGWNRLANVTLTNSVASWSDPEPVGLRARFYRAVPIFYSP